MKKYFVNHFTIPAGLTAVESYLADLARAAMLCVYDRQSLESYADYLRVQQGLYIDQHRRCRPVEIRLDFHENTPGRDVTFQFGRMWIPIETVKREFLGVNFRED